VVEHVINKNALFVGHRNLCLWNRGSSPWLMDDYLVKFGGLSHLLDRDTRDQLWDFTPVGIIETNKIFFELRGVNNPAAPAVELRVPCIEAPVGLTWMIEVWDDQFVIEGDKLVLAQDTVTTRCSNLMFAFHLLLLNNNYNKLFIFYYLILTFFVWLIAIRTARQSLPGSSSRK
jgi:hypothetical protein